MAKRRPQGDGTIRKRSDGRWEARIIIGHKNDGSPMYKSAFAKTQKSALKQLHQLLDLYRDVDLTEECRMTLGEWMPVCCSMSSSNCYFLTCIQISQEADKVV